VEVEEVRVLTPESLTRDEAKDMNGGPTSVPTAATPDSENKTTKEKVPSVPSDEVPGFERAAKEEEEGFDLPPIPASLDLSNAKDSSTAAASTSTDAVVAGSSNSQTLVPVPVVQKKRSMNLFGRWKNEEKEKEKEEMADGQGGMVS
jgi:hypothetical protein